MASSIYGPSCTSKFNVLFPSWGNPLGWELPPSTLLHTFGNASRTIGVSILRRVERRCLFSDYPLRTERKLFHISSIRHIGGKYIFFHHLSRTMYQWPPGRPGKTAERFHSSD